MSAGQRVATAREFLAGARRRKLAGLPPSVMIRELAECRRQLGQVLDVIDGASEVLAQALADAVTYRDPGGSCPRCQASPSGLCDDHATDRDLTGAYQRLTAELGLEVDR